MKVGYVYAHGSSRPYRFWLQCGPLNWGRTEAAPWCREQFGPMASYFEKQHPDIVPTSRWDCEGNVFAFRDEKDAFAFKMRWCG